MGVSHTPALRLSDSVGYALKKHRMRFFSKRNHRVELIAIIKDSRGIANLGRRFLFAVAFKKTTRRTLSGKLTLSGGASGDLFRAKPTPREFLRGEAS